MSTRRILQVTATFAALRGERMKGLTDKLLSGRGMFAALMALALAVRILIPAGFMPMVQPEGVVVALCNGVDAASVVVDFGKKPVDRPHEADVSGCSYAAGLGGGLLLGAATAFVATVPAVLAVASGQHAAQRADARLAAPPPPAIGPPATA